MWKINPNENEALSNRLNLRDRCYGRRVSDLADWTMIRVVRVMASGAMRHVQSRHQQHADHEHQTQESCNKSFHFHFMAT